MPDCPRLKVMGFAPIWDWGMTGKKNQGWALGR